MTTEWLASELISRGVIEIGDGYRAKNSELDSEGLPFARAGNVNNGFDFSDADLLGFSSVKAAGSKISRPGDVVFTSKGTVGRFAFVGSNDPGVLSSEIVSRSLYSRPSSPSVPRSFKASVFERKYART